MTYVPIEDKLEMELLAGQYSNDEIAPLIREAISTIRKLRRLDQEASEYVESVIALRTHFTGEEPYVGWKGLGLALTEELDALKAYREKERQSTV